MINGRRTSYILFHQFLLIISFLLLSFISIFILFKSNTLFGAYDVQFHLQRVKELLYIFKSHKLPVFAFNEFHGASTMILYPYLNILPLVIFKYFIHSYIIVIYLYFWLINFLSLLIGFYSSLFFSKSRKLSYLFSIMYTFSIPLLNSEFTSMDLGSSFAIVVLPLTMFGFLGWISRGNWIELSLGISLLILSHVLSSFISIVFIILWTLVNYKRINKYKIINLLKSILLIILLTSIEWISFIKYAYYNVSNTYPTLLPNRLLGVSLLSFIEPNLSITDYGYGIILIFTIIVSLFLFRSFNIYVKQMFLLSLLIIVIGSRLFPWGFSIFRIFRLFQFPSRFYIIPHLLLSYILSIIVIRCSMKITSKNFVIFSIILLVVFNQMTFQHFIIKRNCNSSYFTNRFVNDIRVNKICNIHHHYIKINAHKIAVNKSKFTNQYFPYYKVKNNRPQIYKLMNTNFNELDYTPINSLSKINYVNNNRCMIDNHRSLKLYHLGYNKFSFTNSYNIKTLILPLFLYNGEHLHLYINHHLIHYHNDNNLIAINNVKNGYHDLEIRYIPNIILVIFKFVLFICGILWLIIACILKLKINLNS